MLVAQTAGGWLHFLFEKGGVASEIYDTYKELFDFYIHTQIEKPPPG